MSWLSDLYKKLTKRATDQASKQSSRRDHQQKPKPSSSSKPKSNSGRSSGSKSSGSSRSGGSTASRPSYSTSSSGGSTYRRPSTATSRGTRGKRQVGGRKPEEESRYGNPKVKVTKAQTVSERNSGTSTTTTKKSSGTALTVSERKAQGGIVKYGAKTNELSKRKHNERKAGLERADRAQEVAGDIVKYVDANK